MLISNVNELKIGDSIQYIGNTLGLFGEIMEVVSINEEKNQCHIRAPLNEHYLTRCDANNIIKLSNNIGLKPKFLHVRGERSIVYLSKKKSMKTYAGDENPCAVIAQVNDYISGGTVGLTLELLERARVALTTQEPYHFLQHRDIDYAVF
jgi:hypothetical protein